jgi:hypothetical protein
MSTIKSTLQNFVYPFRRFRDPTLSARMRMFDATLLVFGYGGPARTATAGRYSEAGLQKSANFVEIQQNVVDLPVSEPINRPESWFIF